MQKNLEKNFIYLDRWLYFAKIFNSLALARQAICNGAVFYNATQGYAHTLVEKGGVIKLKVKDKEKSFKILSTSKKIDADDFNIPYIEVIKTIPPILNNELNTATKPKNIIRVNSPFGRRKNSTVKPERKGSRFLRRAAPGKKHDFADKN